MKIEYNNLYTHFVYTTLERKCMIPEKNRVRIEKYITGIVKNNSSRIYAIYANPEHIHFLISRSSSMSEEALATIIADSSEAFINDNNLGMGYFRWQQSASAFSVSKKDIDKVCKYILNQPEHHKKYNYNQEYESLLKQYQETLKNKINKVFD